MTDENTPPEHSPDLWTPDGSSSMPAYPKSSDPQAPSYGATPYPAMSGDWQSKQKHPQETTILVLGIISMASTFLCFFLWPAPLVVSIVTWVMGAKTLRTVDAAPDAWDGRSNINTGRVLGIVSTIFNLLLSLAFIGMIAMAIFTDLAEEDYSFMLGLFSPLTT